MLAFWIATLVAAFALGRLSTSPETPSTPEEMAAAVRAALAEGDQLERAEQVTSHLEHLDPGNLSAVRAVYDRLIPVIDKCDIRPFVSAWARFDPAGALVHSAAWRYKIKQEIGVEAALYAWALQDPLAARLAYEQLAMDSPNLEEVAFLNLVTGWAHSGEEGLVSYIAGLEPMAKGKATGLVVGVLSRKDGADAIEPWAEAVLADAASDRNFKMSTFRRGARSIARWDPERAAAWAMQHAGNDYAEDGPRIVAEEWADQDGEAALEWLRELPAGEPRDEAVRGAFVQWLKSDASGAEQWLSSETLTAFHDPAVNAYARRLDSSAPAQAVGWCERILGPDRRRGCLKTAATHWYQQDAVAAEAWLQQSPLDEEARRAVRAPPVKRQRRRVGPAANEDAL
ncbi:MAG TPA: hypothetical protein VIY27_08060 [Myxococcota bacterium]